MLNDFHFTRLLAQSFGDGFPSPAKTLFRFAGTATTEFRTDLCLELSPLIPLQPLGG
jgi:hypothetical protein